MASPVLCFSGCRLAGRGHWPKPLQGIEPGFTSEQRYYSVARSTWRYYWALHNGALFQAGGNKFSVERNVTAVTAVTAHELKNLGKQSPRDAGGIRKLTHPLLHLVEWHHYMR
jgi:hypothetical protein